MRFEQGKRTTVERVSRKRALVSEQTQREGRVKKGEGRSERVEPGSEA